jgi:hypothetical protein
LQRRSIAGYVTDEQRERQQKDNLLDNKVEKKKWSRFFFTYYYIRNS